MRILRLAVAAALFSFPLAAYAQRDNSGGGGDRGARMMAALFQGITLSDAQQKQVDSIRMSYRSQMQSAADRSARRDLMQKESADFRSVLTADQQTTFDKNIADMRSRMGSRAGAPQ